MFVDFFVFNEISVIEAIDGTHINVKNPLKQVDSYTNRKLGKSIIFSCFIQSENIYQHFSRIFRLCS